MVAFSAFFRAGRSHLHFFSLRIRLFRNVFDSFFFFLAKLFPKDKLLGFLTIFSGFAGAKAVDRQALPPLIFFRPKEGPKKF